MQKRFVVEAITLAAYGQLLVPTKPVEYIIPYSTILELYELKESGEQIMMEPNEDVFVKEKIGEFIEFFETPLNKKKVERALLAPWRASPPIVMHDLLSFTVLNAMESAQYGELLDPIETELILSAIREQAPILTDQFDLMSIVIEHQIPVQVYDIEDFEFAVETEDAGGDVNDELQV